MSTFDKAKGHNQDARRRGGYTLVELLVVVGIISVFALVMMVDSTGLSEVKLQNAAKEVSSALKLARSESMRTGIPHGVSAATSTQRVRVYQLTPGAIPVRSYTVRHPHDKQLIDFTLGASEGMEKITLNSVSFTYGVGLSTNDIEFNPKGIPYYDSGLIQYSLNTASLTLSAGSDSKTITLVPATGRIVVSP